MRHLAGLVDMLMDQLAIPGPPDPTLARYEEALIMQRPEAAEAIRLLTRLHDRRLPPAWVAGLRPISQWLIQGAATFLGAPTCDIMILVDELERIVGLMRPDVASPRLLHQVVPLAAFHVLGWTPAARSDVYRAIALLVHLAVRRLEKGMVRRGDVFGPRLDRNLWDYLCSARLLLRYAPVTIESALADECRHALTGSTPGPARLRLIEAVVTSWCRCERRAQATVEKRRAALEILLGLEDHIILPGRHHSGESRGGWSARRDDEPTLDSETARDWSGRLVRSEVLPRPPDEAWAEGETGADYYAPDDPIGTDERLDAPARPDRRSGELATMQALELVHELGTAQPWELAEVYRRLLLRPAAQMTRDALEEALSVLLMVEHGLGPEAIRALPLVTGEPAHPEVALDIEADRIWVPLPVIARPPAPEIVENFRPGSPWATAPLRPPAPELLGRLCRVRFRGRWTPGTRPFAAGNLAGRLHGRLQATSVGARRAGDLLARLGRSGMRWLLSGGLPPVVAAGISGRFGFTTRAPSAYANLSEHQVAGLHARAVQIFRGQLAAEWMHRGVRGPDLAGPVSPSTGGDRRFGSMLVPRPEAITGFVRALEGRLGPWRPDARLDELTQAFNRRVLYEYLRLLWTTAVRPIRDPLIGRTRCQDGWLMLADKSNVFTHEARVVPLLGDTVRRLSRLGERAEHVRWRLRLAGQPIAPETADVSFFAVRDRRAVPWTSEEARRVLVEEGFATVSRWPLNVARHTWFTRALEDGVPLAVLDPFLGHVHEPARAGPYSLASMAQDAEVFREFAACMGREAGFRDVD